MTVDTGKVTVADRFEGQVLDLTLNAPKGNVLDAEMMRGLISALGEARARPALKAVVFHAAGPHFSFGASVAEHQADQVAEMLATFHSLVRAVLELGRPTLASVRGQCLGGGMELVSLCHWIFAAPTAHFGQPEIKLGVFPPAACLVLPYRVGQGVADDLVLTGRSIAADEAQQIGLVHRIEDDPEAAIDRFLEQEILPKSAVALRYTVMASRHRLLRSVLSDIEAVERMYLDELMQTADANEGIAAFLEKRSPSWRNA